MRLRRAVDPSEVPAASANKRASGSAPRFARRSVPTGLDRVAFDLAVAGAPNVACYQQVRAKAGSEALKR